jgi:prevent-host-death family protein
MKMITVRELRNRPGHVWKELEHEDLVVTANGKPVGILLGVGDQDLEQALAAVRRARALLAVSRMRRHAAEQGLTELTARELDAEIRAVRRGRRR